MSGLDWADVVALFFFFFFFLHNVGKIDIREIELEQN